MRLNHLTIRHFRCFDETRLRIGPMHALVGSNNAGKSSVLHALDLLFNPSIRKISDESFHAKDTSKQIEIEGRFGDLNEYEQERLAAYLRPDGSFWLMRSVSAGEGEADGASDADEAESSTRFKISAHYLARRPKFEWLQASTITTRSIEGWWRDKQNLQANGHNFASLLGTSRPGVAVWKEKAAEFAAEALGSDDYEEAWVANPAGYAGVLKAVLPHYELVPAVREASDESKVTKTNPFGRLVFEIVRRLDAELRAEIESALAQATRRLNRQGQNERADRVSDLENMIGGYLGAVMPADVEIEFQAPTVETLLSTPRIFVDDGFRGSIEGKGHGMQRAVIFAILRSYAALLAKRTDADGAVPATDRPLILGVEEPELYMHPTAQRTVRRVLREIADGGDQVILTTHSPLLVDVANFDEVIRLSVDPPSSWTVQAQPDTGTPNCTQESASTPDEGGEQVAPLPSAPTCFQLSASDLLGDLVARYPQHAATATIDSLRALYSHAYTATRNEGFFARRLVLAEGLTEVYALPEYAAHMGSDYDFDSHGIAVIECGGKGSIDRLYRIFNELGIPCYVIFDFDKNNSDPERRRESRALLSLVGRDDLSDPCASAVEDTVAFFLDNWETTLRSEIDDYDALVTEARQYLGCRADSKPLEARFIAARCAGVVPATVRRIVEKVVAVRRERSCLHLPTVDAPEQPEVA